MYINFQMELNEINGKNLYIQARAKSIYLKAGPDTETLKTKNTLKGLKQGKLIIDQPRVTQELVKLHF